MGASISQRPGKCLKSRRAKSEEYLGPKRNFKNNMGRFFAPWHNFISESIANSSQENVNATRYFTYSDWINKDIAESMEKSFNEIHRSNSLDKNDYENDYEKLVADKNFVNNSICVNEDTVDCPTSHAKLVIDVNKDSIFEVNLRKGSRGLGFSILEYDGFIFIKQLFPLEAAVQSGMLQEGDIILSANGTALTDLSSFKALQILRTLQNPVTLIVCRLQQFLNKKPITSSRVFTNFNTKSHNNTFKEFDIVMTKVNGSLGFTLRKDESEGRGHIVRALVKEPALSDGRIKPGDQIISVNGTEIDAMTHQEAVKFLRDSGDEVKLKLRRNTMSSSLTSLDSSHFETNNKTLRKEALEMLNDLAVKKCKNESEDHLNNNSEPKCEREPQSVFFSEENISTLKRRDTLFDSRENLSALHDSDRNLDSHVLKHNMQMSNDVGKLGEEPVSLPALDVTGDRITFQHNDPAYHSINVPNFNLKTSVNETFGHQNRTSPQTTDNNNKGLLKWKGIVLDSENESRTNKNKETCNEEIITVQLQRSWNSRLGFSLCTENGATIISAIHADSVAAKDGRLNENDKIVEVNGKNVERMETPEVIEMLRTVRGTVTIAVKRENNVES